ncbi:uncharacterized protein LOC143989399 [Lithobates pipiens]
MPNCLIKTCRYGTGRNRSTTITLFSFPKNQDQIKQWLRNAGMHSTMVEQLIPLILEDKRADRFRICAEHFEPNSFILKGLKKKLVPNAVPTIFPPTTEMQVSESAWKKILAKKPRLELLSGEASTSSTLKTGESRCGCHHSMVPTKTQCDASTQIDIFDFPSLESEDSYFKVASERSIQLDHSYSQEDLTPQHESTPRSRPSGSSFRRTIQSPEESESFLRPSPLPNLTNAPIDSPCESVLTGRKRKLRYEDDSSYQPSDCETPDKYETSLEDNDIEQIEEPTWEHPLQFIKEKKYIVFESCLDALLFKMRCPEKECCSRIKNLEKQLVGSMVVVFSTCGGKHRCKLWQSQPKIKHIAAGNILIAGSIVLSGSSFTKFKELCDFTGIAMFGKSSFHLSQQRFIFPAIDLHWRKDQQEVRNMLAGKPLFLVGDGQCDSPGFSAKYCTYTFMEQRSKKIVDMEVVQVTQSTSSVAMEKFGFQKCLDRIREANLEVHIIGTDRHTGIRKLLKSPEYERIIHQFDIWHYVKNIKRKLLQISKKKAYRPLTPWIPSIVTHFYWCSRNCKGDEHEFKIRWESIMHHVINEHSWKIGETEYKCKHDDLSIDDQHVEWLVKGSQAYDALSRIVLDAQIIKDIPHLIHFCKTGPLETFHSMMLKYRPKRIHYRYDSMEARTKIAVLCHNHNVTRKPAIIEKRLETGETVQMARKNLEFPHGRKKWIVRTVYEKMSSHHVIPILSDMISLTEGTVFSTWRSKNKLMPQNIAAEERPPKSTAVELQRTRFPYVSK